MIRKHVYDKEWELHYLHRYRSSDGSDTTSQNRGPTYSSDSSTGDPEMVEFISETNIDVETSSFVDRCPRETSGFSHLC